MSGIYKWAEFQKAFPTEAVKMLIMLEQAFRAGVEMGKVADLLGTDDEITNSWLSKLQVEGCMDDFVARVDEKVQEYYADQN